jgi:hypothetical protein
MHLGGVQRCQHSPDLWFGQSTDLLPKFELPRVLCGIPLCELANCDDATEVLLPRKQNTAGPQFFAVGP